MFRKLKLQFILTNLAIITVLFITLTAGVYIVLQINMINHARVFSKRMAEGINSGIFPEFPAGRGDNRKFPGPGAFRPPAFPRGKNRMGPPFFYIKTNSQRRIIFQSPGQPLTGTDLAVLAARVFKTGPNTGLINFHHSKYFYYKTALTKSPGTLVVFQDLKQEKSIQQLMVVSLLAIGIVYLILAMTGSLFMAKRAIQPIQRAWQQQKDFLADASHELRTPLTVIRTNLEVVMSNPGETVASQMDWLVNVQEEIQQMTGLVSSLLFLTRLDSESYRTERNNFSLDKVTASVFEAFKPLADAKNIHLSTIIAGTITVYGDESNLRRVMEILLDNALQYTPAGEKIIMRLQPQDKKILLEVADTGEGIDAEHLPKIFDRFYQVDPSRSKGKAGLGLAIAKSIIENHGGTIQVTSRPGSGTTFSVWLPLP
jgi:signal transduction histidine kinase